MIFIKIFRVIDYIKDIFGFLFFILKHLDLQSYRNTIFDVYIVKQLKFLICQTFILNIIIQINLLFNYNKL